MIFKKKKRQHCLKNRGIRIIRNAYHIAARGVKVRYKNNGYYLYSSKKNPAYTTILL